MYWRNPGADPLLKNRISAEQYHKLTTNRKKAYFWYSDDIPDASTLKQTELPDPQALKESMPSKAWLPDE
jgi:hypothetical protein